MLSHFLISPLRKIASTIIIEFSRRSLIKNGNTKPVRLDQVEPRLQELLMDMDDPTFSIYADKSVPVEQVVNMMNIGKRNKYKVILATSPE